MLTFETQNPSFGTMCPSDPHQREPHGPKFEDRSQEETGKSDMPVTQRGKWQYPVIIGETKNNILLTFGELVSTPAINH